MDALSAKETLRVACLQLCPNGDLDQNAYSAFVLATEAVSNGAQLLLLPEYSAVLHGSGRVMREMARSEEAQPLLAKLQELARESSVWILIGSLTIPLEDGRIANRSVLISSEGKLVARYNKIHMFDATLPSGRTIRESSLYQGGKQAVVAYTPWGGLGLSICYDLRFPYLYRALADAGALFIAVPSAFTSSTGPLHWESLLRARAIENGCFVFAPATCGKHPGDHATHGHSLIIDPMGRVLADGGVQPGTCYADIKPEDSVRARTLIPSLAHTRSFDVLVQSK